MLHASHAFEEDAGEIRLRLDAATLTELFAEAGGALAELLTGSREVPTESELREEIRLHARDRDALFNSWLNELIFRSEVRSIVFTDFEFRSLSETWLSAAIGGAEVSELHSVVKAATLHAAEIRDEAPGLSVIVFIDV